jgi:hypothetical protein
LLQDNFVFNSYLGQMILRRPYYLVLTAVSLATAVLFSACDKPSEEDACENPHPFTGVPEDNSGSRLRSVTYVYDRRAVDASYPPKIDSSLFQFSYDAAGKIDSIRVIQNDSFFIYDFSFERNNNRLTAIHCEGWTNACQPSYFKTTLHLQYDGLGKVTLMKASYQNDPTNDVDSFIIKSSNNRIDTVIDRTFAVGTNTDKYAFTYNGAGNIVQMDDIRTSGIFYVVEHTFKYTLSGTTAPLIWGDEAIFWHFFANHVQLSAVTDYMIPPILFHSNLHPSKLVVQGFYSGTSDYVTEYYGSGRPKKMTANVISPAGALVAREAYYYTYAQ